MFLCVVVARSSPCTGVTAAGGSAFGNHILVVQRHVLLAASSHIADPGSDFKWSLLITASTATTSVPGICNSAQFVYLLVVQGYRLQ